MGLLLWSNFSVILDVAKVTFSVCCIIFLFVFITTNHIVDDFCDDRGTHA